MSAAQGARLCAWLEGRFCRSTVEIRAYISAEFIEFYENLLNSLADDEAVYFADAVHPEHQSKPAFGWFTA